MKTAISGTTKGLSTTASLLFVLFVFVDAVLFKQIQSPFPSTCAFHSIESTPRRKGLGGGTVGVCCRPMFVDETHQRRHKDGLGHTLCPFDDQRSYNSKQLTVLHLCYTVLQQQLRITAICDIQPHSPTIGKKYKIHQGKIMTTLTMVLLCVVRWTDASVKFKTVFQLLKCRDELQKLIYTPRNAMFFLCVFIRFYYSKE